MANEAPERIYLGKPESTKSWEWNGVWSPRPFPSTRDVETVGQVQEVEAFEYIRQDLADAVVAEAKRDTWEKAIKVVKVATKGENTYPKMEVQAAIFRALEEAAAKEVGVANETE